MKWGEYLILSLSLWAITLNAAMVLLDIILYCIFDLSFLKMLLVHIFPVPS